MKSEVVLSRCSGFRLTYTRVTGIIRLICVDISALRCLCQILGFLRQLKLVVFFGFQCKHKNLNSGRG